MTRRCAPIPILLLVVLLSFGCTRSASTSESELTSLQSTEQAVRLTAMAPTATLSATPEPTATTTKVPTRTPLPTATPTPVIQESIDRMKGFELLFDTLGLDVNTLPEPVGFYTDDGLTVRQEKILEELRRRGLIPEEIFECVAGNRHKICDDDKLTLIHAYILGILVREGPNYIPPEEKRCNKDLCPDVECDYPLRDWLVDWKLRFDYQDEKPPACRPEAGVAGWQLPKILEIQEKGG